MTPQQQHPIIQTAVANAEQLQNLFEKNMTPTEIAEVYQHLHNSLTDIECPDSIRAHASGHIILRMLQFFAIGLTNRMHEFAFVTENNAQLKFNMRGIELAYQFTKLKWDIFTVLVNEAMNQQGRMNMFSQGLLPAFLLKHLDIQPAIKKELFRFEELELSNCIAYELIKNRL